MTAKGTLKEPEMNKLERAYADHLYARQLAGEIKKYWFQGMTLRLGNDCRYTPDFVVLLASGELEMHEVKGFWRDDARVKIKVAAEMYPFRFIAVQKDKQGCNVEEF